MLWAKNFSEKAGADAHVLQSNILFFCVPRKLWSDYGGSTLTFFLNWGESNYETMTPSGQRRDDDYTLKACFFFLKKNWNIFHMKEKLATIIRCTISVSPANSWYKPLTITITIIKPSVIFTHYAWRQGIQTKHGVWTLFDCMENSLFLLTLEGCFNYTGWNNCSTRWSKRLQVNCF